MATEIIVDTLQSPEIIALLQEHLDNMAEISPPESIHALDVSALKSPVITFWSMWDGGALLGCGALKELDSGHGEIKSMRTKAAYRRRGVARRMLIHIMDEARSRGYARLSLETGSMSEFAPAQSLYRQHGFIECEPFADYSVDPNSMFMSCEL